MIRDSIETAVSGKDIPEAQMIETMEEIMGGHATPAQIGALLVALRMKGESIEEITAAAKVMRAKSSRIPYKCEDGEFLIDTCGTGGDCSNTFNVSTTVAFVVAGAGVKVAKHGNRSVSSKCGSADLMESLGLPLDLTPDQVALCIRHVGIGFLFAPILHSAMKHAIGPRRELGVRTIFNLLGPLTNPAGAQVQLMGVYDDKMVKPLTYVLARLGSRKAFVVHGHGGLDEISLSGPTLVGSAQDGNVSFRYVEPSDFGLRAEPSAAIRGGSAQENVSITRAVLKGEPGPNRDVVLLNAAAALVASDRARTLMEGMALATFSIDSGAAYNKLEELIEFAGSLQNGGH
ncbi:MAG: anthranilate phosphoribosyltransferase [Desulfomonilaceae bacterium]